MITRTCDTCGHTGRYRTPDLAEYHFGRHSCQANIERKAKTARRIAREQAEGVKRDCQCPHARHAHGTSTAYVVDKCRCRACMDANAALSRDRARAKLYGRYDRLVPADEARAHLQALRAQGMGLKRVAKTTGIALSSLSCIIYGKPAARRLQALAAIGWPHAALADRLGVGRSNFSALIHHRRPDVEARTARAVRDLYDELWDKPHLSKRSRTIAARHGWVPPMAWDDIDDPTARPDLGARTRRDLAAEIEHLMPCNRHDALRALGLAESGLYQGLKREGRLDLWERLKEAV